MIAYLSRAEFAERIGVKPDTMSRYKLPEPDAMIGTVRGWLPETVDAWNADRPGKGAGAGRKASVELLRGTAIRLRAEGNIGAALEIEELIRLRQADDAGAGRKPSA